LVVEQGSTKTLCGRRSAFFLPGLGHSRIAALRQNWLGGNEGAAKGGKSLLLPPLGHLELMNRKRENGNLVFANLLHPRVEKIVVKSLLCCDTLLWVHAQEAAKEINSLTREVQRTELLAKTRGLSVRKKMSASTAKRECGKNTRLEKPLGTATVHDEVKLIFLVAPGKRGTRGQHLVKNTTNSPHVHFRSIARRTEKELRGFVPTSDHTVPERLVLVGHESKVSQEKLARIVQKNVGGLDVEVHQTARVDINESLNKLAEVTFDESKRKTVRGEGGDDSGEIMAHPVENKNNFPIRRKKDIQQVHNSPDIPQGFEVFHFFHSH
jgi:hypothetical protein